MKVTVTVEVMDDTSEEKMNQYGLTYEMVEKLATKAVERLMEQVAAPGVDVQINCVATDNIKEG